VISSCECGGVLFIVLCSVVWFSSCCVFIWFTLKNLEAWVLGNWMLLLNVVLFKIVIY